MWLAVLCRLYVFVCVCVLMVRGARAGHQARVVHRPVAQAAAEHKAVSSCFDIKFSLVSLASRHYKFQTYTQKKGSVPSFSGRNLFIVCCFATTFF